MAGVGNGNGSGSKLPVIDPSPEYHGPQQKGDFSGDEAQRKFRPDVYWYLSFRCNLACQHCSVFSSPDVDTSEDLGTEDCMQVVEQMQELNVRCALMSGGEVLFRPDAIEIMQAVIDHDISVGLETNGLLITDAFIKFAQQANERRKFNVCISVDGGTAETHDKVRGPNTFKRTIANLHRLKEANVPFDIQCILNHHNMSTIPNYLAEARALRPVIGQVQFGFLNPVGRGNEFIKEVGLRDDDMFKILDMIQAEQPDFDGKILIKAPPAAVPPKYLGLMERENVAGCKTCQFPLLGVLPNGDITICALSRDNDTIYYGNTKTDRLKDIWVKTRMDMLRSTYVAADSLTGICGDCIWQKSCKGSCRAWAFEQGGSFESPFPLCASLDEAGLFPDAYRLSHQQKALGDVAAMTGLLASGPGCGTCS